MCKKRLAAILLVSMVSGCMQFQKHTPLHPSLAAQARVDLAMEYLNRSHALLALQNIEQALCYDKKNYRTQLALALCQSQMGENRAAEYAYRFALRLAPLVHRAEVHNHYGVFLCSHGRFYAAQQQFTMALKSPQYYVYWADVLYNSGLCFLQAGEWNKAEQLLQRALKHHPQKAQLLLKLAYFTFGKKRFVQAATLLTRYDAIAHPTVESLKLHLCLAQCNGAQEVANAYRARLLRDFPQVRLDHGLLGLCPLK